MAAWIASLTNDQPSQSHRAGGRFPQGAQTGILSQNVRGFRDVGDNRETWMSGWKSRVDGHQVTILLLQETHVTSQAEADALERQWCRGWGRVPEAERPLSFWSITEHRVGGVAVLLHPTRIGQFARQPTALTGRLLQLSSTTETIVNVYTPNDKGAREEFFSTMGDEIVGGTGRLWIGGDFNCVLQPQRDRITHGLWSDGDTESPALEHLVAQYSLVDCLHVHHDVGSSPGLETITYWQGAHGARLDRLYVSRRQAKWVQGMTLVPPHGLTDHCGVITWIRDPACASLRRPLEPALYPILGRDTSAIDRAIGKEVGHVAVAAEIRGCTWEELRVHVSDTLRSIKRLERRRAKRQRKRADRRQRAGIKTLRDLIAYVEQRVKRKSQERRGQRILEKSGNSAHLFQRFVQIDQQRLIPPLQQTTEQPVDETASTADVMAAEWQPLLGQVHATLCGAEQREACRQLYSIPDERRLTRADNDALLAPITLEEVLATIDTLGRYKAAGPDRLNNDFFRDRGDLLAPTLTREFNRVLQGGDMPLSFADAIIVPLPKTGDPTVATNYRPISLLQSSYKLFTKLLANRVQASLSRVINDDQNGFVRGRAMANNIHLMQAILEQEYDAPSTAAQDNAAVVLLDFRKAYDTLDRSFVHLALLDFGYAEEFAALVDRLHKHTSAQFLVNGELSAPFEIVTGIRQGCPLAPLLFLIAVETLKYALDSDDRIQGIQLKGVHASHVHTLSAFVDDSVVFLRVGAMVSALTEILERFAAVSGLQVQPQKSHAIVLNVQCEDKLLGVFPIVPVGQTVPYLGVELGLADLTEANWDKRCAKLTRRLGAVSQYATGVTDRVQVVNLACMPSLLFTAKFFTPPPSAQRLIDNLWRTFIWKGTLTKESQRAHKLASEIMHLPQSLAGLGLHDYRGATLLQAATTVFTWNSRHHDKYWEAFHCLLQTRATGDQPPCITTYPAATTTVSSRAVTAGHDVYSIGLRAANVALRLSYARPPALVEAQRDVAKSICVEGVGLQWLTSHRGQLTVPAATGEAWRALGQLTYAHMPAELRAFWPKQPWYNHDWIRDSAGEPLTRAAYSSIGLFTVGELQLQQQSPTTFTFRNPLVNGPTGRSSTVRKLKQWLCWLIGSRAVLDTDPAGEDTARVYSIQRNTTFDSYEWRLRDKTTAVGVSLADKWSPAGSSNLTEGLVLTASTWRRPVVFTAERATDQELQDLEDLRDIIVYLDGHPAIQAGPTLLTLDTTGPHSRAAAVLRGIMKKALRPINDSCQRGLVKLIGRLERQLLVNPTISVHLQACTPHSLTKQPWGVTSQQHLCKYRLVVGGLNLRDNEGRTIPCPHLSCSTTERLTETHVFWDCPGAQVFWRRLATTWTGHEYDYSSTELAALVFGHTIPPLTSEIRRELEALTDRRRLITITSARVWTVVTHVGRQQLWLCRNAAAFHGEQLTALGLAATAHKAVQAHLTALSKTLLRADATRTGGRLIAAITAALSNDSTTQSPPPANVRLYFDGGSRGNPGPTGTGSVIVECTDEGAWEIVWWDAHFTGDNGTNNGAEHTALLRGVHECAARYANQQRHVTIIGDSQLILAQVAGEASIKTHALAVIAARTQHTLRGISSYTFHHTLRSGNKMADTLANHAMDTRRTTTGPRTTDELTDTLRQLLHNDTTHAWTTSTSTISLIDCLQQRLQQEAATRPSRKRRRGAPTA